MPSNPLPSLSGRSVKGSTGVVALEGDADDDEEAKPTWIEGAFGMGSKANLHAPLIALPPLPSDCLSMTTTLSCRKVRLPQHFRDLRQYTTLWGQAVIEEINLLLGEVAARYHQHVNVGQQTSEPPKAKEDR